MITKIAFVSHPTNDMAASRKFFGDVLGLKLTSQYEDKWCEYDTPDGKSIALDKFSPTGQGPYLALETDDIEKDVARLRKRGVTVVLDVTDNKVCKMAFIKDPSGHSIMLHQMEAGRLKALNAAKGGGAAKASKTGAKAKAAAKPSPAAKPRPNAKATTKAKANATKPSGRSQPKASAKTRSRR
jgi:predicted enzyme related to lactoylglutathione lyase